MRRFAQQRADLPRFTLFGGVDAARGSVRDSVRVHAYLDDTAGPDCQVGTKSGLPAAINEGSVFYEEIVGYCYYPFFGSSA